MATRLYVGNLPFTANSDDLIQLFGPMGEVNSATIPEDFETGRSRGFGFVEMDSEQAAEKAIAQLNGADYNGRTIKVNAARPRGQGKYANGYSSNKSGFGSDLGSGYGPVYGKELRRGNF